MKLHKTFAGLGALAASLLAGLPALAQDGPIQNPTVEQMATMVDKGDTTWMLISSVLVLMMSIPALALFYGGLVRTKNMLSLLMQVLMIVSVGAILWIAVGYSLAFTPGSPYIGGLSKAMLAGVGTGTYAATFSNNVYIPEYAFIIFQMTFACITPALIIGAFAERIKFWPLILFSIGWTLLAYYPIAHMVWFWAGPDFLSVPEFAGDMGLLWGWGALDFAGGTVVHINAGIAGLIGCIVIGPRIGHNKEPMPPHSLTLTMVGASLLWVGWFGFNAGSNLESNGLTALAFLNTFIATAAATVSWVLVEQLRHGRPSLLGAVTGALAGLVAVTPAAGFAAPGGALILGLVVSPVCYIFVSSVKKRFGYDDSLDVFGIHGIGGIIGAIGTGILADPSLGGQGWYDYTVFPAVPGAYDMGAQVMTQIKAVGVTVIWTGVVSFVLFYAIKLVFGLRPSADDERQGLDQTSHGESAYNY
ncbi:ammonium transporter [Tabrizicola sp.]|jgi:ammonium transporter, Amt family|uniref:ammonium transporter n=1 Tax=Tabrizicola sp. TaxID=2005166 RepID=UPI000BDCDA04|nr:ammonium transporter [Tabrizicola sp.]MBY0349679.1 ammonium transporter [Tabrizicola sp.]OYX20744.1 MAG: ammonia channel protein [Rhodobacterales bacterium 32-66-9]